MRTGSCACLAIALLLCLCFQGLAAPPPKKPTPPKKTDKVFDALVTGQEQRTASERRIGQRTIALLPRRSGDDLLRLVPGVLVSRHGAEGKGSQLFLRGFDAIHGADVEVLVAGIPINEASNVHGHGYLDLGFVIPEVVQNIQVQKGSSLSDQGDFATAGSVRFQLGVADEFRGNRVSYEIGSTLRHRLLILAAPSQLPEETFVALEGMSDQGYGQNRKAQRLSLLAQGRLLRRGPLELQGLVSAYGARFGQPAPVPLVAWQEGRIGFYDTASTDTQGTSHRGLVGLRLLYNGSADRLEGQGFFSYRKLLFNEDFTGFLLYDERGDQRRQYHRSYGGGLRLRHERPLSKTLGLSLASGADLHLERITQYEDQVDARQPTGQPWQRNRDLEAWQLRTAFFSSLRFHKWSFLQLSLGLRLDVLHYDLGQVAQTFVQPSPKAHAIVRVSKAVRLFASYGRGLRSPEARSITFGDRVVEAGELSEFGGRPPGLTTSDGVEVGTRYRRPRFEIGGAGFLTLVANEVLFDHLSSVNVALNATRRLGVELDVRLTPLPWLQLQGDASYIDARFVDSSEPVPGSPRFLGTLSGTVFHPKGLRAGARVFYMAPRPLRYGAVSGGAVIVDLSIGYRYKNLQVELNIDNLLDYKWREGEFHYASRQSLSQARSELPVIHYSAGPPLMARGVMTLWL